MSRVSTRDVIRISAYLTDQEGYIKRDENKNIKCTADKVLDAIEDCSLSDNELDSVKDRVEKWMLYISDSDHQTGEYFDNLRTEISKPMLDEIKIGLVASSFVSFDRFRIYQLKNEADKKSSFLGEEGDKIEFTISDYKLIKSGSSKFSNSNNKWYLYKIYNDRHDVIIWFADHNCDSEFANSTRATAVITKLTTYNEVKQTNVSKLRFM